MDGWISLSLLLMGGLHDWVYGSFLSLINERYIFIRGSTYIWWGMGSGQTDRYMGGVGMDSWVG